MKAMYPHPTRTGWICEDAPGGGSICWENGNKPSISYKKDGPMLVCRNGEPHFLTVWERLRLWLRREDAFSLERKYRPHLSASN